jgi:disulfide bond formation protein DsbB
LPSYLFFLKLSFLASLAAIFGSLYFSEVLGYPPCVLCWYQRICIYPLAFIFGIGLLKEARNCLSYASPVVIAVTLLATYHNLLYYGIIPESITPCKQGVSCTTRQIQYFGFITIPLLSLAGFLTLNVFGLLINKTWSANEKK